MSSEQQQLEAGIRAFEAQRALLSDAVVDMAVAPLKAKLASLAAPPAPPPEPAQTLKQVSILFLDVVGSTTLSQHLDPEAISSVFDGAMARLSVVVEAHLGKVMQYAGDSLLAVFGSGQAREDDTERAVLCGLALAELGRTLGAEVWAAHGHAGFNVRVGIHTGGVVLGGGVDAERTVRGIAVNIAARMEQSAPPGALRISYDTYAQVRGLFEVDSQEPLPIKGVDTPLQTYLVRRAKPRQFRIRTRGIEGVVTRMIGRDAELEALQDAYRRLFAERKLAAVTVVADAGIGKSRLLYEFEAWSEARPERFFLFRGRATPATGTQAYGLLRDILAWRFQINDDDTIEAARQKIENGIVPLFLNDDGPELAEGHAHLLGHLIGIEWKDSRHVKGILDDPKQIRNRAFHAAAQMFRRLSASDRSPRDGAPGATPVILQLEDLHWADSESLDFLNYLAEVNRDVPVLVLSFTRPTLFESRADWSSTEGIHQRIDLTPLDKRASRDLAKELLNKVPEIPAALRELLTSSAEGNPFYMEELVKMFIDQGAIQVGEPWKVNAEKLLVVQIPPTLTGVLQARLDGLPAEARRALQQASVVGAVFWDQALAAVEAQAAKQLPALVHRELAVPRAHAQLDGLREYAFRHQVLHQVTYDTVLKRQKREGHAKVAQWLALLTEQGSLRADAFLGLAAEHFELAGDEANAAEFHARAAEQAALRFAHDRVLAQVGRALALLGDAQAAQPAQAELRWRLVSARERTLNLQARRDEQAPELETLRQLADSLDDDRRRAEVALRIAGRADRMSDRATMERAASHGIACAARAGDDNLRLRALRLLAHSMQARGDVDGALAIFRQVLEEARTLGLRTVESLQLASLAISADASGDLVGALGLQLQSLQLSREAGDRVSEATCLSNLGRVRLLLGDLSQARRDLSAALEMLKANDDRVVESWALTHLAMLTLWQGDEPRALVLARQAVDIAAVAQAPNYEAFAGIALGGAELDVGRRAEARQAYARALKQALLTGDVQTQHSANAGLARVALAEGDTATALAVLLPVLDHAAAGRSFESDVLQPRLIELTCYQALTRANDPGSAEWLTRAHSALMTQADTITDPALRQGFLENIPHHRAIAVAWAGRRPAGSAAGSTSE